MKKVSKLLGKAAQGISERKKGLYRLTPEQVMEKIMGEILMKYLIFLFLAGCSGQSPALAGPSLISGITPQVLATPTATTLPTPATTISPNVTSWKSCTLHASGSVAYVGTDTVYHYPWDNYVTYKIVHFSNGDSFVKCSASQKDVLTSAFQPIGSSDYAPSGSNPDGVCQVGITAYGTFDFTETGLTFHWLSMPNDPQSIEFSPANCETHS